MLEIGKVQPPQKIHATTHVLEGLLLPKSFRPVPSLFPNSNSFGVFSHSKGFGAELLSDSLWFSGADPSCAAKRFRGRFHQGFTEVAQVSRSLWSSGADPFWDAKRFCRRITSLDLSPSSSTLCGIFPNSLSFGVFSHTKVLGAK